MSNRFRIKPLSILCVVMCCFLALPCAADTFTVDQANDPTPAGSSNMIFLWGQSFTPTLTGLNLIQFWTEDWGGSSGATLTVVIHSGSSSGPVVGTSTTVLPDGFAGITDFTFATLVTLTPGTLYFAKVTAAGDAWGIGFTPDTYAGGYATNGDNPANGSPDLWFREGIVTPGEPVPEPGTMLLLGSGIAGLVGKRLRKRKAASTS